MTERKALMKSEDWLSLVLGMFIFLLASGRLLGVDLLGWAAKTNVWVSLSGVAGPVAKGYAGLPPAISVLLTFVFLLAVMAVGVRLLGRPVWAFVRGFTMVYWASTLCWVAGHYAYIAATPDKLATLGIPWSLNLTGEAGYISALIAGLFIGNFFTGLAERLKEATLPELYIKTAIVIMGAGLGVKAVEALGLAQAVIFRGLCAIVEAYLIYWAVVYYVARRFFGFSREWAAPLASGISICGVSAAIATGGAIRARPIIPIMVSSLVVIFAAVELLLLPFIAQTFLWREPMVAGAWMALAVKTDGAAIASGAITDALIRARTVAELGIHYKEGWILMTATTVKIFIDIFIGVWSFILAVIWCTVIEKKPGQRMRAAEIWDRFPKFVIGYVLTFVAFLLVCLSDSAIVPAAKDAAEQSNVFRQAFFAMTFFSIGLISNFRKLAEEGIGKLAAIYFLCLFGFILWVGLLIAWLFFHGVTPPLVQG